MVGRYFNSEEDARRALGYDSPEQERWAADDDLRRLRAEGDALLARCRVRWLEGAWATIWIEPAEYEAANLLLDADLIVVKCVAATQVEVRASARQMATWAASEPGVGG
jgi:hypothetical protein